MLGRAFMIRADNRMLKETSDVLNGVGWTSATHPFFFAVVDRLMPCISVSDEAIPESIPHQDCHAFGSQ